MSHIFDALQNSEMARTGATARAALSVTELLERAEVQQIAKLQDEMTGAGWPHLLPGEGSHREGIRRPNLSIPNVFASRFESDHRIDIWRQFATRAIQPLPDLHLSALNDDRSPAAEAFRLLGVRLNQFRELRNLHKLLVTSTLPQEGKTITAANLACALSTRTGGRVLLIDGDLRRASLSRMFGLGASLGLCEYLRGENGLPSTIFRLEDIHIWILPTGKASQNPLDLLQSTKLPKLIDELSVQFDWVIIDSPPVLPLADTSAWMHLVDGILLITRPGTTEKHKLQAGMDAIDSQKLIGLVLNSSRNLNTVAYRY